MFTSFSLKVVFAMTLNKCINAGTHIELVFASVKLSFKRALIGFPIQSQDFVDLLYKITNNDE